MKPLFAEQYKVSPAKTHGLAVGLGAIFLGRTARRCFRSRTATPVYSICTPPGRLDTSIVARAGVFPNSKRCAYCWFITCVGIFAVKYGFTKTIWARFRPADSKSVFMRSRA